MTRRGVDFVGGGARAEPDSRIRRLGPPLAIAAAGLLLLAPLWTRRGIPWSIHSDLIAEHAGVKALASRAVAGQGRLPLWNPSMNCGAPAFANPQSTYVFPPDLLFLILPLDRAAGLVIALNFVAAGLAMHLFCLRVVGQRGAALLAGLAWMLGYRYLAMIHAGWLPKLSIVALLPLLSWACDRLLERRSAGRMAWLALIVGLCVSQGDAQQAYYAGIGAAVWFVVRLVSMRDGRRLRAAGAAAAGAMLGLMLAAPVVLPRLEFAALSTRTESSYAFFLHRPPGLSALQTVLDPRDEGGRREEFWENNFYFGLWLLPLAVAALLDADPRRRRTAVVLFAAAALLVVLCFDTPLLRMLFDWLPGFGLFRQSPRLLVPAQFVLTILAARGAEVAPSAAGRCAVLFLAAGVAGFAGGYWWNEATVVPVAAATLIVGFYLVGAGRKSALGPVLFCLLPVLDAAVRIAPRLETRPLDEAFAAHPLHDTLARRPGNGRAAAVGRTAIPYGMAAWFGIDLANGYASLNLRHYQEYFAVMQTGDAASVPRQPVVWTDFVRAARPDLLRALDVRTIVANTPLPLRSIGYRRVAAHADVPVFEFYRGMIRAPVYVYEDASPLGPAFFAASVRTVRDEDESLRLLAESRDARQALVLADDAAIGPTDGNGGTVRQTKRGIDAYEYVISSRGRNLLVISQVWYPGWRAELDEREAPLFRTNHALLGCVVPPGEHTLRLTMTCPAMWRGVWLAAAAVAVAGTMLTVGAARGRRGRA